MMKPLISRRCFCRLAVLGPFAAMLPPTETEPSAALLYEQGVRMLREGRTYEKAQANFARAAEMEPANPDYQIALGCALASRVASLVWAGCFADRLALETAAYPKWKAGIAEMEAKTRQELKDKNADAAEVDKFERELKRFKQNATPPIGRVFLTKDDKAPFRMTPAELSARLTSLNKQALAAWEKALVLGKTPEEKAHAQYVRGWGMRLLRFYCEDESGWRKNVFAGMIGAEMGAENEAPSLPPPLPSLGVDGLPTEAQIKTAFRESTEAAPQSALYWQARADALTSGEVLNPGAEATELYRKAALLDPKSANLWNRVYDRETTIRWKEKQTDAPDALNDLHHAQARDRANSWYGYEEAGRVIKTSSWSRFAVLPYNAPDEEKQAARETPRTEAGYAAAKRAVALIERANNLPRYIQPVYQNSVPALLARAWNCVPEHWRIIAVPAYEARFKELSRTCDAYAESLAADKNNTGEAVRVLRVVQAMGLRVTGGEPWPTGYDPDGKITMDDYQSYSPIWLGGYLVNGAFSSLVKIAKQQNDPETLESITREQTEWMARKRKWIDAQPTEEDMPPIYELYNRT